uniref:Uncharacterized protein n=1 Tax=Rhodosorus marinus TaxID=101924 RepID=A0A7S2ZTH4_9RHOD
MMIDLGTRQSEETIRALRTSCELLSGLLVKLLNELTGTIGDRQRLPTPLSETCARYECTPQSRVMMPRSDARNRTDVHTTNLLPEVLACKGSLLSVLRKLVRAQNLLNSISREQLPAQFHEYNSVVA